jgi:hypothetical protein
MKLAPAVARAPERGEEDRDARQNRQHCSLNLRVNHKHHPAAFVLPFPKLDKPPAERQKGSEQSYKSDHYRGESRTRLARGSGHDEHSRA